MAEDQTAIRVVVVGVAGRMGREVLRALTDTPDIEVVGVVDRPSVEGTTSQVCGIGDPDLPIDHRLGELLDRVKATVIVDFTHPSAAPDHAITALKRGVAPVIGTSGLTPTDLQAIREACEASSTPALFVPNFAIGAVLMMRFAAIAAKWMPDVEIVEMHHDQKVDAPSGTSIRTAEMIAESRLRTPTSSVVVNPRYEQARGAEVRNVRVHSVRLKGLVAHQRVLFGGDGEVLTISHDSLDRRSFMGGVLLAVRQVRSLKGLVVGLDNLMFP